MLQKNGRKYIQDVVSKIMSHGVVRGYSSCSLGRAHVRGKGRETLELGVVVAAHEVTVPHATELCT